MKIFVYGDCHFCQYSSILRKRGDVYSQRLENEIASVSWAESQAVKYGCSAIVCLGDFFDKSDLNAEELTALKDIQWANIPHYFLVGNHEMGVNDLSFSSAHLLQIIPFMHIIDKPSWLLSSVDSSTKLVFLPYILEDSRENLDYYIKHSEYALTPSQFYIESTDKTIVFSHNDIKGIQLGKFETVTGFDVKDISDNCNLFINGHIHNYGWFNDCVVNLGNLTGQNFSEDASIYPHYASIVDTETLEIGFLENPNALNFYKFNFTQNSQEDIRQSLNGCRPNAVVSIKVKTDDLQFVKKVISENENIRDSRVVVEVTESPLVVTTEELHTTDPTQEFKTFVISQLGVSEMLLSELEELK